MLKARRSEAESAGGRSGHLICMNLELRFEIRNEEPESLAPADK